MKFYKAKIYHLMVAVALLSGCDSDDHELIDIEVQEEQDTPLHTLVKVAEEPLLARWLEEVYPTHAQTKTENFFLSNFDMQLTEGVKRLDSLGNLMYSMYLENVDPLSLYNLWLYKDGDFLTGRVIHQRISNEWLLAQDSFPGWHSYTGYFTVYNLEGDVLYETEMIEGESAEPAEEGSRSRVYQCTTRTIRVCTGVGRDLADAREDAILNHRNGDSRCYYEITTTCRWVTPSLVSGGPVSGAFIGSGQPIPLAENERRAACSNGYTYQDVYGCVPNCGSNSRLNSSRTRCICVSGYEKYRGRCVRPCASGVRNSNGTCVAQRDIPCPGDPIKNTQIAPSYGSGLRGGLYGYTRAGGTTFHAGIDIKVAVNSNLFAMHSGVVSKIKTSFAPGQYDGTSYGNFVEIRSTINGQTVYLKYNHLNSVDVRVGQRITAGDIIGLTGNTGNAQTRGGKVVFPHIHIWAGEQPFVYGSYTRGINPAPYIATKFNSNGTVRIRPNCN